MPGINFSLDPIIRHDAIEQEWRRAESASSPSFFTSWTWIGTWLSLLPPDVKPHLLRATRGDQCVGLAVLVKRSTLRHYLIRSRQLHFNSAGSPEFDCIAIEHNGFQARADAEELWAAFVQWFRNSQIDVDELVLPGVAAVASLDALCPMTRSARVPAYAVDLKSLARSDDPAELLSRNGRQQLRRAFRHYQASGPLLVEEAETAERALNCFQELRLMHIASWTRRARPHAFMHPFFEQFHQRLIRAGMQRREIQLLRISAGQSVLGYLYNLRHNGRIYAYQSGFAVAGGRERPGYVCHALAMRYNALRGESVYDFMAGSNQLKRSFATTEYALDWITAQQPRMRFHIENGLKGLLTPIMGRLR